MPVSPMPRRRFPDRRETSSRRSSGLQPLLLVDTARHDLVADVVAPLRVRRAEEGHGLAHEPERRLPRRDRALLRERVPEGLAARLAGRRLGEGQGGREQGDCQDDAHGADAAPATRARRTRWRCRNEAPLDVGCPCHPRALQRRRLYPPPVAAQRTPLAGGPKATLACRRSEARSRVDSALFWTRPSSPTARTRRRPSCSTRSWSSTSRARACLFPRDSGRPELSLTQSTLRHVTSAAAVRRFVYEREGGRCACRDHLRTSLREPTPRPRTSPRNTPSPTAEVR